MIETSDTLAREAARQRAFVFTERIWDPGGRSLFGSKAEAIEWFTVEILRLDQVHGSMRSSLPPGSRHESLR